MSRIVFLSVVVASLSTIVGCGAHSSHATAMTARDEASWTPPEEVAMKISDAKEPETQVPASENLKSSYRPNRQERPRAGAVHAATY
jgi:hypothetical protein